MVSPNKGRLRGVFIRLCYILVNLPVSPLNLSSIINQGKKPGLE